MKVQRTGVRFPPPPPFYFTQGVSMQIKIDVPDGESGDWEVSTFNISETEAEFHNISEWGSGISRSVVPGTYKRLCRGGTIVMSNTPAEIRDHLEFHYTVNMLQGDVLINGLGLGVALKMILKDAESVTVIEASEDVIKMYAPTYQEDPKVEIIHADAFTWKPPKGKKYKCVWHDIWDNIDYEKNLPEMHKLHRKYGRRSEWQGSWCRGLCEYKRNQDKEYNYASNVFGGWSQNKRPSTAAFF